MLIYGWLILAFWLIVVATWVATASRGSHARNARRIWRREIALRLAIFAIVVITLHYFRHTARELRDHAINRSTIAGLAGAALCALGAGLAVAARLYLGRSWGMPMTRKENPVLVTAGPYATARHPIYGGLLLAMVGSAIGQSIFWLLPLVLLGPYFIYSARREEKFLTARFPQRYSAYVKQTKMLLPWLL
ncbi:MAG TPA: isoprenylcysteine carboxylmethyltransferase family protein [Rhizomicrobium sp.]|jgi:protein-S-isoprenylcysteine O-methyltransferase Ste14